MKKAVSLIELVFAIVIIGIVVMSFPLILTQTSSNIKMALQQEAILNAKSYTGIILSHPWDANSLSDTGQLRVLQTNASTSADNAFYVDADGNRKGSIVGEKRRVVANATFTPTTDGAGNWGNATTNDVDDFDNKTESLTVVTADLDFILEFDLDSNVEYVDDKSDDYGNNNVVNFTFPITGAAGVTNIKMVEVTAKANAGAANEINITLRAYASNVGGVVPLRKDSW